MEPEFITYQRFNDIALADGFAAQLEEHGIEYVLEEEVQAFNPTFAYADTKEYVVKINSSDFEKVRELLKQDASEHISEVEKDYYLYDFTDDELLDVIIKADEWNAFDVQLARKLLADRGHGLSDLEVDRIMAMRLQALKTTEPSQSSWIAAGYTFALAGGVLGFFIGWHLWTYKKTLPDGERVFNYSEHDRQQGKIIFYLSFVGLIITFIYKLAPAFSENH